MTVDKDTLAMFKKHFRMQYSYISHDLSDGHLMTWLRSRLKNYDGEVITTMILNRVCSDFSDFLLSQGLASEVQE